MADRLTSARALLAVALLACGALPARAQTGLADPTRPPQGHAAAAAASGADAPLAPVLQSVLLPGKVSPVAIIGGEEVRLGQMVGGSRLVRLPEREAVLEGPGGRERLLLTPGIEKTRVQAKPPARTVASARQRKGEQQ